VERSQAHGHAAGPPRTLYDRTLGRITGWFDRLTQRLGDGYQTLLAWSLVHKVKTVLVATATFAGAIVLLGVIGKEFVPKADFSETQVNFYTPVGSSLEVTEMRARQVDAALREFPEVRHTVTTINSGFTQGKIYGSVYVRLTDRKERARSIDALTTPLRERLARIPGITVTNIGVVDLGGSKSIQFSVQGSDLAELERLATQIMDRLRQIPGLVDLDSTLKPDKPTLAVDVRRDAAATSAERERNRGHAAHAAGRRLGGQLAAADGENYDVRVQLAPLGRDHPADLAQLPLVLGANADGSARVVRLSQVAEVTPSTGPNQINRRDMSREVNIDANALGRSSGEVSADIRAALDAIAWPPGYRYSFGAARRICRSRSTTRRVRWRWRWSSST